MVVLSDSTDCTANEDSHGVGMTQVLSRKKDIRISKTGKLLEVSKFDIMGQQGLGQSLNSSLQWCSRIRLCIFQAESLKRLNDLKAFWGKCKYEAINLRRPAIVCSRTICTANGKILVTVQ
jgi:hypothetical protein